MNRRKTAPNRRETKLLMGIAATLLAAAAVGGIYEAYEATHPERYATATIRDKARVCSGGGSDQSCSYLIYTDHGTYEDTDSVTQGKFNSSDIYGDLTIGQTYEFHLRGVRSGFMSWYPNIIGYTHK